MLETLGDFVGMYEWDERILGIVNDKSRGGHSVPWTIVGLRKEDMARVVELSGIILLVVVHDAVEGS